MTHKNTPNLEALLSLAAKHADQAQVRLLDTWHNRVSFADAKLDKVDTSLNQRIDLKLIKDGKQGAAVTYNLNDPEEFVQNALHSLAGEVDAPFDLPGPAELPELDVLDPEVAKLSNKALVDESKRVCTLLKARTKAEISTYSGAHGWRMELLNSKGFRGVNDGSGYGMYINAVYPGGASGVSRNLSTKGFAPVDDAMIEELATRYNEGEKLVKPASGDMQVLFVPSGAIALFWRLVMGLNGFLVYRGISPIKDKVGQQIVSDKLTFFNDPHDDSRPGAESFDEEGVPTRKLMLVENGVLQSFYWDLKYAAKMGVQSTGTCHGGPNPQHLRMAPGDRSVADIITGMKRGIILEGCIGAHSGNLVNGDYSVAVGPAYYVENGQIVGQVKDAMVAGNAYETLSNISAVSRERAQSYAGRASAIVPSILCEGVSVTIKQ